VFIVFVNITIALFVIPGRREAASPE